MLYTDSLPVHKKHTHLHLQLNQNHQLIFQFMPLGLQEDISEAHKLLKHVSLLPSYVLEFIGETGHQ